MIFDLIRHSCLIQRYINKRSYYEHYEPPVRAFINVDLNQAVHNSQAKASLDLEVLNHYKSGPLC